MAAASSALEAAVPGLRSLKISEKARFVGVCEQDGVSDTCKITVAIMKPSSSSSSSGGADKKPPPTKAELLPQPTVIIALPNVGSARDEAGGANDDPKPFVPGVRQLRIEPHHLEHISFDGEVLSVKLASHVEGGRLIVLRAGPPPGSNSGSGSTNSSNSGGHADGSSSASKGRKVVAMGPKDGGGEEAAVQMTSPMAAASHLSAWRTFGTTAAAAFFEYWRTLGAINSEAVMAASGHLSSGSANSGVFQQHGQELQGGHGQGHGLVLSYNGGTTSTTHYRLPHAAPGTTLSSGGSGSAGYGPGFTSAGGGGGGGGGDGVSSNGRSNGAHSATGGGGAGGSGGRWQPAAAPHASERSLAMWTESQDSVSGTDRTASDHRLGHSSGPGSVGRLVHGPSGTYVNTAGTTKADRHGMSRKEFKRFMAATGGYFMPGPGLAAPPQQQQQQLGPGAPPMPGPHGPAAPGTAHVGAGSGPGLGHHSPGPYPHSQTGMPVVPGPHAPYSGPAPGHPGAAPHGYNHAYGQPQGQLMGHGGGPVQGQPTYGPLTGGAGHFSTPSPSGLHQQQQQQMSSHGPALGVSSRDMHTHTAGPVMPNSSPLGTASPMHTTGAPQSGVAPGSGGAGAGSLGLFYPVAPRGGAPGEPGGAQAMGLGMASPYVVPGAAAASSAGVMGHGAGTMLTLDPGHGASSYAASLSQAAAAQQQANMAKWAVAHGMGQGGLTLAQQQAGGAPGTPTAHIYTTGVPGMVGVSMPLQGGYMTQGGQGQQAGVGDGSASPPSPRAASMPVPSTSWVASAVSSGLLPITSFNGMPGVLVSPEHLASIAVAMQHQQQVQQVQQAQQQQQHGYAQAAQQARSEAGSAHNGGATGMPASGSHMPPSPVPTSASSSTGGGHQPAGSG